MKRLLNHELTHMYQQREGIPAALVDSLQKDSFTFRPSLVVMTGGSVFQKKAAAGMLARSLGKQLYSVDLSAVSSKYLGETEKNLDKIFHSTSSSGWLLFFDEADALFGKRTAVRDSHDRFANQETSYLLSRIERHTGIVILSTNVHSLLFEGESRVRKFILKFPPFA
ncbi:AAA+ superfamily predicted ATPase [Catalinimonas alkaloidigena]|uniref:AAA family ATPase n=1 Tax=Catalinimonas alkaloidigena TaxID=1075417 RepID=UPI002404A5FF|nr:AAA family ATPase [Catalinimonas alkaloidigena]MDF9794953.1 AAA+ superfamily predicted ATPase [Catalinimonas alkaloidigena]